MGACPRGRRSGSEVRGCSPGPLAVLGRLSRALPGVPWSPGHGLLALWGGGGAWGSPGLSACPSVSDGWNFPSGSQQTLAPVGPGPVALS